MTNLEPRVDQYRRLRRAAEEAMLALSENIHALRRAGHAVAITGTDLGNGETRLDLKIGYEHTPVKHNCMVTD